MTTHETTAPPLADGARASGRALVAAALGFVLLYLSNDFVTPNLASSAMPLPDASAEEIRAWVAENQLAVTVTGIVQLLSVSCLAAFAAALRRAVPATDRAARWGFAAVALMMLSSVLAWVLAAIAPSVSADTANLVRTANFIAGGTAHVLALGVFAFLASRVPGMSRPVRVLGWVAVVPAVLSLSSLVVFQGAAFILLGRLLGMIWTVTAAVSVTRRLAADRRR